MVLTELTSCNLYCTESMLRAESLEREVIFVHVSDTKNKIHYLISLYGLELFTDNLRIFLPFLSILKV